MKYLVRSIEDKIINNLQNNKVVLIYGTRRTGKTELVKSIITKLHEDFLLLNGEDIDHIEFLKHRSTSNYKKLLAGKGLLIIDEAQGIPEIGLKLKLMIDTIPNLRIIATGSSSFELNNQAGEPLVGRKKEYLLFPLAQLEFSLKENIIDTNANFEERMILGGYPELTHMKKAEHKKEYLKDLINSYLLKDIFAIEGIKKRDKIMDLLRIIAFRIGSEISLESIGRDLQISKNTVERYLDILSKVFIIHKLKGYSNNFDNEITKKSKWYFYDNGIRNAIISNFNPLNLRDDVGKLWENYFIAERIKYLHYNNIGTNTYFWRSRTKQEIDWIEENNGKLDAYEIKWSSNKKIKTPTQWKKNYPDSNFTVINRDNYLDFIED